LPGAVSGDVRRGEEREDRIADGRVEGELVVDRQEAKVECVVADDLRVERGRGDDLWWLEVGMVSTGLHEGTELLGIVPCERFAGIHVMSAYHAMHKTSVLDATHACGRAAAM
jgi:hypothetical protein